jgi:hypothetical protein
MRGHEDNPAASPKSLVIVLHPVLRHKFRDVSLVQFGEVAEFHKKAAKIIEASTQDLQPLPIRELRKSHLKVAKTGRALPPGQVKAKPGYP